MSSGSAGLLEWRRGASAEKPGRLGFFAPFGGRRRAPALKRANRHKNAKGAWRPLVCPANRARQMRIGITTYLNSSFSGTVMRALELASPRLT